MNKLIESWKYPILLLVGIGIANVGGWIYLIALNLIVFDMTGSPLAVAGLYIIKPLAAVITNSWAGSLIDRLNKRNLMVFLDLGRAAVVVFLPSLSSLSTIYFLVFIINMGSAVFEPTSMTYITKLLPSKLRKRFNALRSLVDSGGFLIGPAIAGLLFMIGSPIFAIYVNAIALVVSGIVTLFMPDLEKNQVADFNQESLSLTLLKKDWGLVKEFSLRHVYIMLVYFLFSCVMVMTAAVDSLEAVFSKEVLSLSDGKYGFLVSIAGAGIVVGAIINTLFVKRLTTLVLMGGGSLLLSSGYIIYAFSYNFFGAAIGFFILSFALAFANTGFYTFYQSNIPIELMGRIGSIYSLIEAVLVILFTTLLGLLAQFVTIQFSVIIGVVLMLVTAISLFIAKVVLSKTKFHSFA